MLTGLKAGANRETLRIVAVYALVGSAWIYLSDTFFSWLIRDPAILSRVEVLKGVLFVLLTSLLLYRLIGRFAGRNAETIAQLAGSEARFQTIYHSVNDALFIHDAATGRIIDVNRTMCSMYGYGYDEAVHLRVGDLSLGVSPFGQSEALQRLELAAQGAPQIFEWRSKKKDGTLFWSEVNMRSTYINGEPRVIVMVRDITARKEAQEALRQNEETLKVLMEEMPAGVGWTDEAGTVLYLNRCITEWFGYTIADVPTIDHWMLRAWPVPEYREKVREAWSLALATTRERQSPVSPIEARITCNDGSQRHVILNIRLVHDRIVYIFSDITQWDSRQSELLKSQKLESLGVLAGGIAHDFNNILTSILGNISFLGTLLEASHPGRRHLEQAEKASLRAAEVAHQLLTFAKGGQPVKKAVSVEVLVQECLALHRGPKISMVVDLPPSLDAIDADEGQINQAFNNVIINAVQSMPEGGTLTVKGENAPLGADNSASLPAGSYVRLSFCDQGCGISEEDQQRMFDPYFTTKAGGTGLGLASVHSIVTKHNGKIEVTSAIGKGTTFTFYLPSTGEPPQQKAEPAPTPTPQGGEKGPILVMDDEEPIRILTAGILEFLGYEVVTCASGEEAVSLYREAIERGAPFFAAIMDLTVPGGMGGKEASAGILALHPEARLIVSSGYSKDPVMARYDQHGFCASIVKPYRCEDVQQVLALLENRFSGPDNKL